MVGIPIPYEHSGVGHAPELKISPLPSKLLARLHEVADVFNHESHKKALMLALRERQMKGPGYSKKLNSLFCLWSNRLRENFHTNTYLMFVRLAQEDALAGDAYGMECLFRFLSYGLERAFRLELFLDFEDLAMAQYKRGDLYGVEKYAAFWHYGGKRVLPSSVTPNTQLMHLIKEKYPTLSSFKGQRYIERDVSFDESQLTPSHLGIEVPPSPTASIMACSEFSFGSPATDDWLMMSSPPSSRLSASAPAFTPLGLRRWGNRGIVTDHAPALSGLRPQSWLKTKPSVLQPLQVSLQVFEGHVSVKILERGRTTAPMAVPITQRGFPAAFSGSGNATSPQAIGSMKRASRASGSSFSVLGTTPEDRAIDRFPSGVSGGSGPRSMPRPMLVGSARGNSSRNRRSVSEISNSPSAVSSSWGGRPGSHRAATGFGGRSARSGKKGSLDKGISAWPSGWGDSSGSNAQRWPRGGRPRGGEQAWGSRDSGQRAAADQSPERPAPPEEIAMEVSMGGAVMDEDVVLDMEAAAVDGSTEKMNSPQASDLSQTDSSSLEDGVVHAAPPSEALRRKCNEQA